MRDEIRVSILIPIHNAACYLRECLDSCLAQDLEELEVIAVDDASTDGSLDILGEYSNRDSRMTVVPLKENGGTLMARKAGVRAARGRYVYLLDSDDRMGGPSVARNLFEKAECYNADLLLYSVAGFPCQEDPCYKRLAEELTIRAHVDTNASMDSSAYLRRIFSNDSPPTLPAGKFFRREPLLLSLNSMPDGCCILGEDTVCLWAFLACRPRVASVDCVGYFYRCGNGISTNLRDTPEKRLKLLRSVAVCCRAMSGMKELQDEGQKEVFRQKYVRPVLKRVLSTPDIGEFFALLAMAGAELSGTKDVRETGRVAEEIYAESFPMLSKRVGWWMTLQFKVIRFFYRKCRRDVGTLDRWRRFVRERTEAGK